MALCLGAAALHVVLLLGNRYAVVSPPFFYDTLAPFYWFGADGGSRNLLDVFVFNNVTEYRPRFLTWLLMMLDTRVRYGLYEWFLVPATFSVCWIFYFAAAPYLLFRSIVNITNDRTAALVTTLAYACSIGFLASLTFAFTPGKPMTNVAFIAVLWLASSIDRSEPAGRLLFYRIDRRHFPLWAVLFLACFLDEVGYLAPLFPVFLFPERFWRRGDLRETVANFLLYSIPSVMFLLIVLVVVPLITQSVFGYRFDFVASVLNMRGDGLPAGEGGVLAGFTPEKWVTDTAVLLGDYFFPLRIAASEGSITEHDLWIRLPLVAMLLAGLYAAFHLRNSAGRASRLVFKASVFFVTMTVLHSLLMGRHLVTVHEYYYGSVFAVLIAVIVGLTFWRLRRSAASILVIAGPLAYSLLMQIANFHAINSYYADYFRTQSAVSVGKNFHVSEVMGPPSSDELHSIHQAWRERRLDAYVRKTPISSGAIYLAYELRFIDVCRSAQAPAVRNDHVPICFPDMVLRVTE